MDRDELLRECRLAHCGDVFICDRCQRIDAALLLAPPEPSAEDVREACAKVCDARLAATLHPSGVIDEERDAEARQLAKLIRALDLSKINAEPPDTMKWDIGGGTPASAAIVQVMDADGKYPSEKQPMTITTTTNAAPDTDDRKLAQSTHEWKGPYVQPNCSGSMSDAKNAAPGAGVSEERIREIWNIATNAQREADARVAFDATDVTDDKYRASKVSKAVRGNALIEPDIVCIRQLLSERGEREGWVSVPKEVKDFYDFADTVFVPFTSQQEELKKSLDLARNAMLAAAGGKEGK